MSMFFHFGFGRCALTENGIYVVVCWFKNSRFRFFEFKTD